MPMQQVYGPYYVRIAYHIEDAPVGVEFKVKELSQNYLTDESGKRWAIEKGSFIRDGSRVLGVYREHEGAWTKVAPTDLQQGDRVALTAEVMYGPPDAPEARRFPHVTYAAFMSSVPCDEKFNFPNSVKYAKATDKAQTDEIAELKAKVIELERLLQGSKTQAAQVGQEMNQPAGPPRSDANQGRSNQGKPKQLVP